MKEIGGWDDPSKTLSCRVLRTCIHLRPSPSDNECRSPRAAPVGRMDQTCKFPNPTNLVYTSGLACSVF